MAYPGTFTGASFSQNGATRSALPGTGWLDGNKPVQPPKPAVPPPTAPATAPTQPASPFGGMFNVNSPQGFGQMAGMLKPVTKAVLGMGGMPALMAIYGSLSGSKDYQTAMTPQKKTAGHVPLIKLAFGNGLVPTNTTKAVKPSTTGLRPSKIVAQQVPAWGEGITLSRKEYKSTPPPRATIPGIVAKNTALYSGAGAGLKQTVKALAPEAHKAIGGMRGGGGLLTTPLNGALELADAAGVLPWWAGGKEINVWEKPTYDSQGQIQRDASGKPVTTYGFNRNALGWDMNKHKDNTTPDGTFLGGRRTGNSNVDSALGYAGASFNAATNPIKSIGDTSKFLLWEANPLRDIPMLWNRKARKNPKSTLMQLLR